MNKVAYYDIETEAIDNLEGQRTVRTIHSLAIAVDDDDPLVFTSRPTSYSNGSLLTGTELLNSCQLNVGHNSILYDKPVLEAVLGIPLTAIQLDTLILSKLTYTKAALFDIDRDLGWFKEGSPFKSEVGSYGLAAFSYRLGNHKIDFHDWSELSEEMCIYNKQDVVVTRDLYKVLLEQPTYPSQRVIDLEMNVATILRDVMDYGFYVDRAAAEQLRDKLLREKFTIKRELLAKYRPLYLPKVVQPPHTTMPAKARKVRTWMYNPSFEGYWKWNGPTNLRNQLIKQPDSEE